MGTWKKIMQGLGLILIAMLVPLSAAAEFKSGSSIKVVSYLGSPRIQMNETSKQLKIARNVSIDKDVVVQTGDLDLIKLNVNKRYELIVFPGTTLNLWGMPDETDFWAQRFFLKTGQVHIKKLTAHQTPQNLKFESDFFSWDFEPQSPLEFYLDVNGASGLVQVCNRTANMQVKFFDHETTPTLKTNEGIDFQGSVVAGQIEFDRLLEGRKIPKGKWSDKKTCSFEALLKPEQELAQQQAAQHKKAQAKAKAAVLKTIKEKEKFLCHEPNGQLNQCQWILKQDKCLRYRCNAEGRWQDPQEIMRARAQFCTKTPKISACDY